MLSDLQVIENSPETSERPSDRIIESFSKVLANLQDSGYRVTMINNYLGELDDEDRRDFFDIPTRYALDLSGRAAVRGWLLAQRAEVEREIWASLKRVRAI